MTTLYLHIGMQKTGSTSIQTAFTGGREYLARYGVGYFHLGKQHSSLLRALFGEATKTPKLFRETLGNRSGHTGVDKAALMQAFDGALAANTMPKLVMSAEMLFGFKRKHIARMKERLSRFFDEMRIIVYVRDPISWASSHAQQVLKKSYRTLDKICDPKAIAAGKGSIVPYYRAGLEPYIKEFGREAVDIRLFDHSRFINGNLISDFCAAIGEPSLAGDLSGEVRNAALSYEAVLLVEQYKVLLVARDDKALSSKVAAFRRRMISLEGTRFALPRETLEHVRAAVADDVAWLQRIMGAEVFKDYIYPPEATTGPAWATTTLRQLVEMIDQASDVRSPKPALQKSRQVAPPVF